MGVLVLPLAVRWDGHDRSGIFDRDLNNRNYYSSLGDYRSDAPAVALWLVYRL